MFDIKKTSDLLLIENNLPKISKIEEKSSLFYSPQLSKKYDNIFNEIIEIEKFKFNYFDDLFIGKRMENACLDDIKNNKKYFEKIFGKKYFCFFVVNDIGQHMLVKDFNEKKFFNVVTLVLIPQKESYYEDFSIVTISRNVENFYQNDNLKYLISAWKNCTLDNKSIKELIFQSIPSSHYGEYTMPISIILEKSNRYTYIKSIISAGKDIQISFHNHQEKNIIEEYIKDTFWWNISFENIKHGVGQLKNNNFSYDKIKQIYSDIFDKNLILDEKEKIVLYLKLLK
ncbi:MAG: hypothetical protein NZZ41_03010 [Candidatus Dojkabacteria bacterium]|nr:hypothetical protein [Candidatus Dojkabacteria bacterium]